MTRDKTIKVLLFAIFVAIVLNLVFNWRNETPLFLTPQGAQAQQVSSQYFVLDRDSFIITANSEGDTVYVYHFNRKPVKEESTIRFITKAIAGTSK